MQPFDIFTRPQDVLGADFGGGFGANMRPEDEALLAQAAREAAAMRLARGGRAGFDPSLAAPQNTPASQIESLLFPSTAGGQSPPLIVPQMNAPQAAMSLSAGIRPDQFAGGLPIPSAPPLSIAPQNVAQPQPQQIPPSAMAAATPSMSPPTPDFSDRLQAGLAGFANAGSPMQAIGNLVGGLTTGHRQDARGIALNNQQMMMKATYHAVLNSTGDPNKATMAALDPDARKFVLESIYGPKKPAGSFKIGSAELPFTFAPDGSAQLVLPGGNGGPSSLPDLISYLQSVDAEGKRQNSAAEAKGKAQGENAAALPTTLANSDDALKVIEQLRNHPGKAYALGGASILPGIPGTKQQDFITLLDQAKGKVFLQAYQTLKGGGQITEIEGTKAENALARLNRAQSQQAFDEALNDLESVIRSARSRAGVLAGGKPTPAAPGWTQIAPGIRLRERAQ